MFLSANWALANDLAPGGESRKFLGLTNLATAGAGALSRLDGLMIDALNKAKPEAWWGYTALFILGAVGALLSLALLARVREPNQATPKPIP
jgi:MFS family permease